MSKLENLHVYSPSITDAHLVHLQTASNLRSLALSSKNVTGAGLMKHLKGLNNLQSLICFLTDDDLRHLEDLSNLQTLWLRGNLVTDVGLAHLQRLKTLKALDLIGTRVTEDGVAKLRKAMPQTVIRRSRP